MDILLTNPQTRARRALRPNHTLVLPWGRGSGKSWFQVFIWCVLVAAAQLKFTLGGELGEAVAGIAHRGIRIVVLGPTRKQLVDIYGPILTALLGGPWAFLGGKINRSTWRIEFPGGSWIQFFGMDTADSARGLRCDFIASDECDDIDPADYDSVAAPFLSEPWSLKLEMLSGTPRRGRFGLLFRQHNAWQRGNESVTSIHATYRDAWAVRPDGTKFWVVDQAFVEKQRSLIPPAIFGREWESDFDAGEGLVYDLFVEAPFNPETGIGHLCVPRSDARPTEVLVGVDWGYEDPGVFLEAHVFGHGKDAEVFFVGETVETKRTLQFWEAQATRIRERCIANGWPAPIFWADPSQPANIQQIRVNSRVDIRSANNAIEDGITTVSTMMFPRPIPLPCSRHAASGRCVDECSACRVIHRPRLFVSPACTNFLGEVGLYRRKRDPKDRDRYTDKPEDANNHVQDAARYLLHNRFGKPVAPLRMGQEAVTN